MTPASCNGFCFDAPRAGLRGHLPHPSLTITALAERAMSHLPARDEAPAAPARAAATV